MAFSDTLRYYFQLLGAMFLTSQTLLMASSIILGVLGAIAYFMKDIVL